MELKNTFKYLFVLLALVFLVAGCGSDDANQANDEGQDNGDSDDQNELEIDLAINDQLIENDDIELGELI